MSTNTKLEFYVTETTGIQIRDDGLRAQPELEVHVVGPFGLHYFSETINRGGRGGYEQRLAELRARAQAIADELNRA